MNIKLRDYPWSVFCSCVFIMSAAAFPFGRYSPSAIRAQAKSCSSTGFRGICRPRHLIHLLLLLFRDNSKPKNEKDDTGYYSSKR